MLYNAGCFWIFREVFSLVRYSNYHHHRIIIIMKYQPPPPPPPPPPSSSSSSSSSSYYPLWPLSFWCVYHCHRYHMIIVRAKVVSLACWNRLMIELAVVLVHHGMEKSIYQKSRAWFGCISHEDGQTMILFMFVHLWFEAPLFMFDLHNPFASWTEIHPHPNRKLSQNCRSKIDCAAWPLYRDPATLLVADCFIDLSKPGMRSANHIFSKYCEEDVLRTPSQTWAQYERKCFDVIPPSSQLVIPCSNWIQVRGTSPCHACHVHKISTQLMVEVISQAGRRKKWQEALQLLETQRIAT